jgi:hypothetical protein
MGKFNRIPRGIVLTLILASLLYISVIAAPTVSLSLSASSIDENMSVGSVVGDIEINYSGDSTEGPIVFLTSGADAFGIEETEVGYSLVTAAEFDYETIASYTVAISVIYTDTEAEKTFAVTVNNVDEVAPVAEDGTAGTDEDTLLDGSVTASDSVDSVEALTYELVDDVLSGSLTFQGGGTYSYTPDENYNGSDSFTFRAYDGSFYSNTATVDITVSPVNDPPENTESPTVGGVFSYGNILTAENGTWNDDADGGTSTLDYSYQWQAAETDGGTANDIAGENTATHTVSLEDKGKYIRVR